MLGGFRVGRLFGVEIFIDWTLLGIFLLIAFDLGAGLFPAWHPDWTVTMNWTLGLVAAALLIASILVHELSHAVVARAFGIPVERITLFLFGGLAQIEREPPSPRSEFLMAVVGPLVSMALGLLATFGAMRLAGEPLQAAVAAASGERIAAAIRGLGPSATLLLWLGPINVVLGVFNLVPGFPLDGGRLFRAVAWAATGNLLRATRWASFAGQAFAWVLMGLGVADVFSGDLSGLWLVLVGWFLNNAALLAYREALLRHALETVTVAGVMETRFDRVSPSLSVRDFVRDHVMATEQSTFPVEAADELVGMVTLDDVRRIPQSEWAETTVGQIMTPAATLATLPPEAAAERALDQLNRRNQDQVLVMDGNRFVGLVRRRDLARWRAVATQQGG
jgi:Zn-dependent protease/predicted transcriptional regulator